MDTVSGWFGMHSMDHYNTFVLELHINQPPIMVMTVTRAFQRGCQPAAASPEAVHGYETPNNFDSSDHKELITLLSPFVTLLSPCIQKDLITLPV
jgi:hypothetical protein